MAKMVCPKCGNELKDQENYCNVCEEFCRPMTCEAYRQQEDSKEFKTADDEGVAMSSGKEPQSVAEKLLGMAKDTFKNARALSIAFLVAVGLCIILAVALAIALSTANTVYVSRSDTSQSDVSQSDSLRVGDAEHGYITVPTSWSVVSYSDAASNSLQYVSNDGKRSVTLAQAFESESTLSKCASEIAEKMETISINDIEETKTELGGNSCICVTGTYQDSTDDTIYNIAAYMVMDENDYLSMCILATSGDLSNMNEILESWEIAAPHEEVTASDG